ncbi:hypothetical protein CVIRNUC_000161 [Coccomyxa viridis]|uniref:Glycosyltransferase 2-like domain-containing protein n=1 Tax=Coccomyxa viridis TaxID=1274662 RepID=A0AAV1HU11_9CHLO|nr:hypothetical protein CVIRNUC_000161 [Coccomyxa viridis]
MYIPSLTSAPATGLCRRYHIASRAPFGTAWCLALAAFLVSSGCPVAAQDQSRVEPRLLLGTRSAQYGGIFVVNTHPVEDFKAAKPTLHIIIPTTGRKTLFKMIRSLESQLSSEDHLTIGFDGQDKEGIFEEVQHMLRTMPGNNEAIMEQKYGDMGNSIRDKHKKEKGDFVMFADDDNWYVPDALSTVRAVVSNDWDALYVFQLQMAESPGSRIPNIHQGGEVEYGNVDSGCGVIPVKHVHHSDWFQDVYGADGQFYHQLSERLPRTYLIPKVIFVYSGAHG